MRHILVVRRPKDTDPPPPGAGGPEGGGGPAGRPAEGRRREVPGKLKVSCERRGYCGPFVDEPRRAVPGPSDRSGLAECVRCGRRVGVTEEFLKWEAALYRCRFGIDVAAPARPCPAGGAAKR